MRRYYTRACNFYYGSISKNLIKEKKSYSLNGNNEISFDEIEIISRKLKKKISINQINRLPKQIKNNIDLDLKKIIFEFCLSKKIISIVSSYLGVMPILNNISVYINIPNDVKDIRGSMNWHRDDFGYRSMDLFIPITT